MSPLVIVLLALAPLIGAAVVFVMARRLRGAEVARASAETEVRSQRERLEVAERRLAENARAISELGRDLHARLATMAEHFAGVGAHLGEKAVASYNRAVGSLESRVLVAARRFEEMGAASSNELAIVEPVETSVRDSRAPELHRTTLAADG